MPKPWPSGRRGVLIRQRLHDTPAAADAWFWKIQCDIIDFLLNRYSETNVRPTANPAASIAADLAKTLAPAPVESSRSDSFPDSADVSKMPRKSEKIAPLLQKISQANQDRYELAHRLEAEAKEALRLQIKESRAVTERVLQLIEKYDLRYDPDAENRPPPDFIETDEELPEEIRRVLALDSPPRSDRTDQEQ